MVELRPFRGLRYAAEAGEISHLVAPPSESLDAVGREGYADRSLYNVVRLAAPEAKDDDRSRYIRYARAAADLTMWRKGGLLSAEPASAIYRVRQRFGDLSRTGVIAGVRTLELPTLYTAAVHAHDDRLRLIEATRAFFEVPVAVGKLSGIEGLAGGRAVTVRGEDGVETTIEPIYLQEGFHALTASDLTIVDGADGWRAACEFSPEGWAPLAIFPHAGTALVPLYRLASAGASDFRAFLANLPAEIRAEEHHSSRLYDLLVSSRRDGKEAAAVSFEGGRGYLLTGPNALATAYKAAAIRDPGTLRTSSDHHLAIRSVEEGAGAAFLALAPSLDEALAQAPLSLRSSTAFPRLPSGLVMASLADEVAP
ncbi:DUF1015 family protein [bacterium]|nr:MAG: DUF1015 family protein [bacterium]